MSKCWGTFHLKDVWTIYCRYHIVRQFLGYVWQYFLRGKSDSWFKKWAEIVQKIGTLYLVASGTYKKDGNSEIDANVWTNLSILIWLRYSIESSPKPDFFPERPFIMCDLPFNIYKYQA